MTNPAGVITYRYEHFSQTVPFFTMDDVESSLRHAIRTGHDIDNITCYVRTESDANKLFAIMDAEAGRPNVHGSRARVFQL